MIKLASSVTSKYRVVAYQRLKTIERFKSPELKVIAVAYERWSHTGSHTGGGLIREVVAYGRWSHT